MTKEEIIKALRDMARYPTVTLPRDSEALKVAADLLAQPDPYAKGYADAMNWKVQNHIEHLPAAQPEQEPVAWVYPEGLDALKAGKPWTAYGTRQEPNNTALYLSPQPDIPPYAWVTFTPYGDEDDVWYENPEGQLLEGWTYKPLYDTTPPQRTWVGLTDEEITDMWEESSPYYHEDDFAKAIEARLKQKNI